MLFGKVSWFKNIPSMIHPEIEQLKGLNNKNRVRIKPIYRSSEELLTLECPITSLLKLSGKYCMN